MKPQRTSGSGVLGREPILFCLLGIAGSYVVSDTRRILARIDGILEGLQTSSDAAHEAVRALAASVRAVFTTGSSETAHPPPTDGLPPDV